MTKTTKKKSTIIFEGAGKPLAQKERHYVDNKKLYEAIKVYYDETQERKKKDLPPNRIPEYIGGCFLLIANNLSMKYNFKTNERYREELVSDAVENCVIKVLSFNPYKSTNPFSYFTQTCFYAFLRRIQKENKNTYVKLKSFQNALTQGGVADFEDTETGEMSSHFSNLEFDRMDQIDSFIDAFEKKNKIKSKRKRGKKDVSGPLSDLFGEDAKESNFSSLSSCAADDATLMELPSDDDLLEQTEDESTDD